MDGLLQGITIYHKNKNNWIRYSKIASVRNASILNRNTTGVENTDNGLIRIFDTEGYNDSWNCQKGDVIVIMDVSDNIKIAPLTELTDKYGKDNVLQVVSIDKFIFEDSDIEELNHIKIGVV